MSTSPRGAHSTRHFEAEFAGGRQCIPLFFKGQGRHKQHSHFLEAIKMNISTSTRVVGWFMEYSETFKYSTKNGT